MSVPARTTGHSKDFTQDDIAAAKAATEGVDEASAPSSVKMQRTIHAQITGTMNGFNMMGPDAATWRPVEGKHAAIFGLVDDSHHSGITSGKKGDVDSVTMQADLAAATQSLRNANITKATLLQVHNTFPVPLGVTLNILPRTEVVDTGERYTFTTMPNSSVNLPHCLFEAGESQSEVNAWKSSFPTFNSKNLETQGVLVLNNCPYVFVNEKHPVINLCRVNKAVIGVDIDTLPKMDNEWYKLARPLMATCCDIIRTKILSKMRMPEDLSQICLQLHRVGGVDWSHVDKADVLQTFAPNPAWDQATLQAQIRAHEINFTERPATFMARIQLEYEIPK